MTLINCIACGEQDHRGKSNFVFCVPCSVRHRDEGELAVRKVAKQIRSGAIPKASSLVCVDCGDQARNYDHRDYLLPLAVSPVCRSCNQKRGPAFDSGYRPELVEST